MTAIEDKARTLLSLADRVESLSGPINDELLDIAAAEALGWHQRRVTKLGLNGRTPGSWLWFPPNETWGTTGRRKPPKLSGPRQRKATAASLRSIASQVEG